MRIQLSDHFTYSRLLRYAFPSICTMLFTSVYSIVDGYFVSNYVGKSPFAALNFIMPALMILGALGTMLGTGGSALVAKTLGEGDRDRANRLFSLFVYGTFLTGAAFALAGFFLLPGVARLMGAEGELAGRRGGGALRPCAVRRLPAQLRAGIRILRQAVAPPSPDRRGPGHPQPYPIC